MRAMRSNQASAGEGAGEQQHSDCGHQDRTARRGLRALGLRPVRQGEKRGLADDDLDLRPIYHRLQDRVKAHVLICMLACYLTWHLRQAWTPLTYTDEHPPARANPVTPARRSPSAGAKAASKTGPGNQPVRSFRDLIDHLATLTRDTITVSGQTVEKLTAPTPTQRRAFDLIGAPIPLTLT